MTPRVATRGFLAGITIVILAPIVVVIGGALGPSLPVVGRFGSLYLGALPWIDLGAIVAALAGVAALLLRGGAVHGILAVAGVGTLAVATLLTGQLLSFATDHGADISAARLIAAPPAPGQPDASYVYRSIDGVDLRAELWRAPADAAVAARHAAVVYVHGGGFTEGGLRSRPELFRFLAERGYQVLDIEYRLAPPPRWKQAPGDLLCALAWAKARAIDLDIDAQRIVVAGDSAGGNLALLGAYLPGLPTIANGSEAVGVDDAYSCFADAPIPAAVIAISPAADLIGIWADDTIVAGGGRFPEAYTGGVPSDQPAAYEEASPITFVRDGLPPSLIVTGAIDHLVRLARVTPLADSLQRAGVDVTLVVVPYADHAFEGQPNGFGEQLLEALLPPFLEAHT